LSEIFKTDSIVLRSSRWSESSKIVHLFTPDKGYVKVIAKGALQQKSPFRGTLETLNLVEIVVSHKESRGLQLITSASLQNSFQKIRGDLEKTAIAFSIIELIQQLLRTHEPLREFFECTTLVLSQLNSSPESDLRIYLWHYMLNLSRSLGFGWDFDQCLSCGSSPSTPFIYLDYENGGIICQKCLASHQANTLKIEAQQWQFLKMLSETDVETVGDSPHAVPGQQSMDYTSVLIKHLSFHTDTTIELKSLKWYG
jgi:DNA repair protein RecO (recombination protein O)